MSVSRVGGKAQSPVYRQVAGRLKLEYSRFKELEAFSRFGSHLDAGSQKIIDHGERIRACLGQSEYEPVSVIRQVCLLLCLSAGLLDLIALPKIAKAEALIGEAADALSNELKERLSAGEKLQDDDRETVLSSAKLALKSVMS